MNITMLTGNVGKDPDVRYTKDNKAVANFSLATKAFKKDAPSDWHKCVAFGQNAETIEKYVKKGQRLDIIGHSQTRSWDKDGHTNYVTEVVVDRLEFAGKSGDSKPQDTKPAIEKEDDDFDNMSIPF